MSLANRALGAEYLWNEGSKLDRQPHCLPPALNPEIARLELRAMGVGFDPLASEQERFLASCDLGT